jgi:uncharacterized protein (DUF2141 family)
VLGGFVPRLHRVLIHSTVEITAATNQSVTATVMIQALTQGTGRVCMARKNSDQGWEQV